MIRSKEETMFAQNEVVWAKIRGYPWWPGVVVQIIQNRDSDGTQNIEMLINFIGDNSHSQLGLDQVAQFHEQCEEHCAKAKGKKLLDSIKTAKDVIKGIISIHEAFNPKLDQQAIMKPTNNFQKISSNNNNSNSNNIDSHLNEIIVNNSYCEEDQETGQVEKREQSFNKVESDDSVKVSSHQGLNSLNSTYNNSIGANNISFNATPINIDENLIKTPNKPKDQFSDSQSKSESHQSHISNRKQIHDQQKPLLLHKTRMIKKNIKVDKLRENIKQIRITRSKYQSLHSLKQEEYALQSQRENQQNQKNQTSAEIEQKNEEEQKQKFQSINSHNNTELNHASNNLNKGATPMKLEKNSAMKLEQKETQKQIQLAHQEIIKIFNSLLYGDLNRFSFQENIILLIRKLKDITIDKQNILRIFETEFPKFIGCIIEMIENNLEAFTNTKINIYSHLSELKELYSLFFLSTNSLFFDFDEIKSKINVFRPQHNRLRYRKELRTRMEDTPPKHNLLDFNDQYNKFKVNSDDIMMMKQFQSIEEEISTTSLLGNDSEASKTGNPNLVQKDSYSVPRTNSNASFDTNFMNNSISNFTSNNRTNPAGGSQEEAQDPTCHINNNSNSNNNYEYKKYNEEFTKKSNNEKGKLRKFQKNQLNNMIEEINDKKKIEDFQEEISPISFEKQSPLFKQKSEQMPLVGDQISHSKLNNYKINQIQNESALPNIKLSQKDSNISNNSSYLELSSPFNCITNNNNYNTLSVEDFNNITGRSNSNNIMDNREIIDEALLRKQVGLQIFKLIKEQYNYSDNNAKIIAMKLQNKANTISVDIKDYKFKISTLINIIRNRRYNEEQLQNLSKDDAYIDFEELKNLNNQIPSAKDFMDIENINQINFRENHTHSNFIGDQTLQQ